MSRIDRRTGPILQSEQMLIDSRSKKQGHMINGRSARRHHAKTCIMHSLSRAILRLGRRLATASPRLCRHMPPRLGLAARHLASGAIGIRASQLHRTRRRTKKQARSQGA